MCILISKPATTDFKEEWVADFFTRNSDGYGVMYIDEADPERRMVCYEKGLGKLQDWMDFYEKHKHRECCFHLRMKTHGHIDMANCHPYIVSGFDQESGGFGLEEHPVLLMHNGVLGCGNDKDRSKSDTWHYVREFLRPILTGNRAFMYTPQFKDLIEKHIGASNKFALLGPGGTVLINKSAGVEFDGAWFSNTYAWNATKAGVYSKGRGYSGGAWSEYDGYGGYYDGAREWNSKTQRYEKKEEPKKEEPKKEVVVEPIKSDDLFSPADVHSFFADWKTFAKRVAAGVAGKKAKKNVSETRRNLRRGGKITHPMVSVQPPMTGWQGNGKTHNYYLYQQDIEDALTLMKAERNEVWSGTHAYQLERLFKIAGKDDAWYVIEGVLNHLIEVTEFRSLLFCPEKVNGFVRLRKAEEAEQARLEKQIEQELDAPSPTPTLPVDDDEYDLQLAHMYANLLQ